MARYTLLVRIPKGQLGEDTNKLLGSLILAQVWQAATAGARIAPDKRRDATLIIDEAQNFLTLANSLDTRLAEARKLEDGLRSLAVPVRDTAGAVVAAVNVSTHTGRGTVTETRAALLPALRRAAARIEADLHAVSSRTPLRVP